MKASLAGHNVLVLFATQARCDAMAEGFSQLGANVFSALTALKAAEIKVKWDIDIVVCEPSFISGVGEKAAFSAARWSGKSAPLLFACGVEVATQRRQLNEMGMLKIFAPDATAAQIADGIVPFLYDPREHLRELAAVNMVRQISLMLQNADGKWPVEVNDWNEDGAEAHVENLVPAESTGVLTVVLPDPKETRTMRFAVRWEVCEDSQVRFRILAKDRARWADLIAQVEARQSTINQFLLASPGR